MAASTSEIQAPSLAIKRLLACGVIGPLLFIAVFSIAGATRPQYSAWHHFVSSLSQGEHGWIQIANFIVCGVLVCCFALGLRRVLYPGQGATWGPLLLGSFGLGLVGAGIFVTDTVMGYPPDAPSITTLHGILHDLITFVLCSALPVACFVLARRFADDPAWRGWAAYSVATGILVIVFFISTGAIAQAGPGAPAGFFQRISIITGWSWIALLAYTLIHKPAPIARGA